MFWKKSSKLFLINIYCANWLDPIIDFQIIIVYDDIHSIN